MQGEKCLHVRGKERVFPKSEFGQSTNHFRILSGLIWGYFSLLGATLFSNVNHGQSFRGGKKDLSFMKARYGFLIICSHINIISQDALSSLVIPERHMTCFHFCQSTYFKISLFLSKDSICHLLNILASYPGMRQQIQFE